MSEERPSVRQSPVGKNKTEPRRLWFVVRYNWDTRETNFARYDSSGAHLYKSVGPNESVHRCEVVLTPTLGKVEEIPELVARECYNETDQLHPDAVTPADIMGRINMCRVIPILPFEGHALTSRTLRSDGKKASQSIDIQNKKGEVRRRFIVTVEEAVTEEEIIHAHRHQRDAP